MAFAGLDVGTSGSKMLVYDLDGNIIFTASRKYTELGDNGRRELEPETVMKYVKEVLREVGDNCPEKIDAMAVTSLGESVVCLDKNNRALANSMLTGDCRGIPETQEIIDRIGAQKIFEITGLPPNELYGLPKYMWLNRNSDAVKNAKAILFYEDYVGYMLTGERKVSYSSAARSMACSWRMPLSMRQFCASSTAARGRLPANCSRQASNFSLRAKASATEPAKPTTTFPS